MIVISAATGELGRLVVDNLLHCVPADNVAVAVRNPEGPRSSPPRASRSATPTSGMTFASALVETVGVIGEQTRYSRLGPGLPVDGVIQPG